VGDGFSTPADPNGPKNQRLCLDAEGIFLDKDGSFWISDEYGPFVYKFDKKGTMIAAIEPPAAILPIRNGKVRYACLKGHP
jgi:hypothetical protein